MEANAHTPADPNSTTAPPIYTCGSVQLRPISLGLVAEPPPRVDLVEGLIPQNHVTIMHSEGGLTKSYIGMDLAMCVALGEDFLGLKTLGGPTLYVDWELDEEDQTRRAYELARGHGRDRPPANMFYLQAQHPISSMLEGLKAMVRDHGIRLVVIDSVGYACGRDSLDAEQIIAFFGCLRSLNVTVVAIDHETKAEPSVPVRSHVKPFGSVYKFNAARSVLRLTLLSRRPGKVVVTLEPTKSNFAALGDPLHVQVEFQGRSTYVSRYDPLSDPDILRQMPAREQILVSLMRQGPGTIAALAKRTGLPEGTVRNGVTELKKAGRVREVGKEGHAPIVELVKSTPARGSKGGEVVEKTASQPPGRADG